MDRVIDKASRGSEVPLRALWCKAGGRWLVTCDKATAREYIYIEVICIEVNILIYNPVNGLSGSGVGS